MNLVEVEHLDKTFFGTGRGQKVLNDVSFSIAKGEVLSLFGPNGCGKTTLMSILAGLDTADNEEAVAVSVPHNKISLVFQDYRRALLPWWDAARNVSFPLLLDGVPSEERSTAVHELLVHFGVELNTKQSSGQLSGGEAQLVSILRALIRKPDLLILDEPFSSLDYEATIRLQNLLMAYLAQEKLTVILVSHSLDDALFFSDRTLFLSRGPGHIVAEVQTKLPRPRQLIDQTSTEFREAKALGLAIFEDIVSKRPTL